MYRSKHPYEVHLEAYVNGDASGGITFKVFQRGADITATVTNSTTIGIAITDIEIVTSVGGNVLLVADSDADGKRIAGGNVGANGGIVRSLQSHHYCAVGKVPKIIGPATGETRAILHGYLTRD